MAQIKIDFNKYAMQPGAYSIITPAASTVLTPSQEDLFELFANKIQVVRDVPTADGYISEALFKQVINDLCTTLEITPVYLTDVPDGSFVTEEQYALVDETGDYLIDTEL